MLKTFGFHKEKKSHFQFIKLVKIVYLHYIDIRIICKIYTHIFSEPWKRDQ